VRARHKKWAAPYLEEHPEIVITSIEGHESFFSKSPLYLEIGAGKGDFVMAMSSRGGYWLALEREISICGLLAKKLVDAETKNVLLFPADFDVASEMMKNLSFDGIYLNFSDPWPKKKHWKRRLTERHRLAVMASLLKDGGFIAIKTDNDSLYEYTKLEAEACPLTLEEDQFDYAFDETKDAMSEYERNFRAEKLPIHRLVYRKKKE
jgi:tRNA (guanine-N7-)-methyltransferase